MVAMCFARSAETSAVSCKFFAPLVLITSLRSLALTRYLTRKVCLGAAGEAQLKWLATCLLGYQVDARTRRVNVSNENSDTKRVGLPEFQQAYSLTFSAGSNENSDTKRVKSSAIGLKP